MGINAAVGTHDNPVWVDQVDLPIGTKRAENSAGITARHAVEEGGRSTRLLNSGEFARFDRKPFPVHDCAFVVLCNRERRAVPGKADLPVNDVCAMRVGVRAERKDKACYCQCPAGSH